MKKTTGFAGLSATLVLATAALASPQESVTFTGVQSNDFLNGANEVRTNSFTGGYTATKIRVTGTLTSIAPFTWSEDSRIRVTPPNGAAFNVQPFTGTTYVTESVTDFVVSMPTPSNAAGTWTFRFYESFVDDEVGGADAVWDTITFTLDDEPVAPPATLTAVGGVYTEVEDNDTKSRANIIPSMNAGESIAGTTSGTSTISGDINSADTFRIKTAAAPLGVYRYRLTHANTGFAGTIRGLFQDAAGITPGTDATAQFSTTVVTGTPLNTWYGFGKQEEVYYRVTGTASTSSYQATLTRDLVSIIDVGGSVLPGNITFGPGTGNTADLDFWIYDSNFNAIPDAGNDEPDILTRNLSAGTYYIAWATYNFANELPSPSDDTFAFGNVLDFPNAALSSSTTTIANFSLSVTSDGGTIETAASRAEPHQIVWLRLVVSPPVVPTGSGSASPNTAFQTGNVLFVVDTTPAIDPDSTDITVTANLSSIGGSATQTFFDNGTNGDLVAGDGNYSFSYNIPLSAPAGSASVPFTVADAQARSSNGSINLTIVAAPDANTWNEGFIGTDAGELLNTAQVVAGDGGAINSIIGTYEAANMDMFQIQICDPSSFSASTVGGATADTQLFLFNALGAGVSHNDDASGTPVIRQSTIDNTGVTSSGIYYLAIGGYNRDPVDESASLLWLNTPFTGVRTPDGPGAANLLSGWVNTAGTASYTITLTGVCSVTSGPICGTADFDGDGDNGTDANIEAFFNCLAGNCCDTCFGADFDADGDTGTDADIEAFFRVLAGQPC